MIVSLTAFCPTFWMALPSYGSCNTGRRLFMRAQGAPPNAKAIREPGTLLR